MFKSLKSPNDMLINGLSSQLIYFTNSLIKLVDAKISSSNESVVRIFFQTKETDSALRELDIISSLFFILQNILKSREFDIVQTVRLLQNCFRGFFSNLVS